MKTIEMLMEQTELTRQAIYKRINNLDISKSFEINENGKGVRVFSDIDAYQIINYQPKKPGRKPNV